MTAKEHEANEAEIREAWDDLCTNKAFLKVFEKDLQRAFDPFAPCFQGDGNPYTAAQRDGQKQVISHIWKRQLQAKQRLKASDNGEKPPATSKAKV